MTAAAHVGLIEQLLYNRASDLALHFDSLSAGEHSPGDGMSCARAPAPWSNHDRFASSRDSDGDGIVDALDNHPGPGAVNPFENS